MSAPVLVGAAAARRRLVGVSFILVMGLLVGLAVAVYGKQFTSVVLVQLRADRAGNQLARGADVKLRGLVVGEVRSVRSSTGGGATLQLALDPARPVPSNVTAQLLPKTLFGEKFVALIPGTGDARPLRDGDVIGSDRSSTAIETQTVLDDLIPLLTTLHPEQLSLTLNALSAALRGRGNALGDNLARTGAYLARLNPQLPQLQTDLSRLASVTTSYAAAAPDLLRLLDNASFSSRSLVDQRSQLAAFLSATTGFADSADSVITASRRQLVQLAADSRSVLAVYQRYAPQAPCLLASIAAQEPLVERAFGGSQPGLHITLQVVRDNGGYTPGQEPVYGDQRSPSCYGLDPAHPIRPMPDYYNPNDGYYDGQPTDPQTGKPYPPGCPPLCAGLLTGDEVLKALMAPVLGTPQVPDIATMLLGPVARGTRAGLSP
ncbi:MAG: MCE family protein [Actinomycetota bacterium]|nr:MCE family protein [Actinomycetota bacterium]